MAVPPQSKGRFLRPGAPPPHPGDPLSTLGHPFSTLGCPPLFWGTHILSWGAPSPLWGAPTPLGSLHSVLRSPPSPWGAPSPSWGASERKGWSPSEGGEGRWAHQPVSTAWSRQEAHGRPRQARHGRHTRRPQARPDSTASRPPTDRHFIFQRAEKTVQQVVESCRTF